MTLQDKYINAFSEKHSLEYTGDPEKGVSSFVDKKGIKHFFELGDIAFDIDNDIPSHVAIAYSDQGREGNSMPDYTDYVNSLNR